jgi:hypothetical protein
MFQQPLGLSYMQTFKQEKFKRISTPDDKI